jgi:signal transduction histidine kinase
MPRDPDTPNLRDLLEAGGWPWKFLLLVCAWSFLKHGVHVFTWYARPEERPWMLWVGMPGAAVILFATTALFARRAFAAIPAARAIAYVTILASVGIAIWNTWTSSWYFPGRYREASGVPNYLWSHLFFLGPLAWAWYFFGRSAWDSRRLHELTMARERLESGLIATRLQALHAQVEPHFLFNTLAHVKALHATNPAQGRLMLDRMIDYLRIALPSLRDASQTLGNELELARAYLDIQRIRLGPRLEFEIDVDPILLDRRFPPMMLATLVENAVKHGIGPRPEGGRVRVAASLRDQRLRLEVSDTGAGLSESLGKGIGISNVRARLEAAFGKQAHLSISSNRPRGVLATIEVPA